MRLLWTSRLHLPEKEVKYFWTVLTTPQIHPSVTKYSQVTVIPIHKIYSFSRVTTKNSILSWPHAQSWGLLGDRLKSEVVPPHELTRKVTCSPSVQQKGSNNNQTYMLFGKGRMGDILQSLVGGSSDPRSSVWALLARGSRRKLPLKDHQQPGQRCGAGGGSGERVRNCCLSVRGSGECF